MRAVIAILSIEFFFYSKNYYLLHISWARLLVTMKAVLAGFAVLMWLPVVGDVVYLFRVCRSSVTISWAFRHTQCLCYLTNTHSTAYVEKFSRIPHIVVGWPSWWALSGPSKMPRASKTRHFSPIWISSVNNFDSFGRGLPEFNIKPTFVFKRTLHFCRFTFCGNAPVSNLRTARHDWAAARSSVDSLSINPNLSDKHAPTSYQSYYFSDFPGIYMVRTV